MKRIPAAFFVSCLLLSTLTHGYEMHTHAVMTAQSYENSVLNPDHGNNVLLLIFALD